jgi:hypothetical protein
MTKTNDNGYRAHQHRDEHPALCAPPVRMVVVDVWAFGRGLGPTTDVLTSYCPVVAIRSCTRRLYYYDYATPDDRPTEDEWVGAEDQLLRKGWVLENTFCEDVALYVDPREGYLVGSEVPERFDHRHATRVVVCTWPEADDEQRLPPVAADLARELEEDLAHAHAEVGRDGGEDDGDDGDEDDAPDESRS